MSAERRLPPRVRPPLRPRGRHSDDPLITDDLRNFDADDTLEMPIRRKRVRGLIASLTMILILLVLIVIIFRSIFSARPVSSDGGPGPIVRVSPTATVTETEPTEAMLADPEIKVSPGPTVTERVPGPTRLVPGPTVTRGVPGPTVTLTQPEVRVTVTRTKIVPGPTVTVVVSVLPSP